MPTWTPTDDTEDLRAMSADVVGSVASAPSCLSARDAARALCGLAGWIANQRGVAGMQRAMAELARYEHAWSSKGPLRALPHHNGRVDESVVCIAAAASTLVPFFGAGALRSAMAFWAVESDPSVWQLVAAA